MKILYFSLTGQTRRFINKLKNVTAIEITADEPDIDMDEPFVLITPSYAEESPTESHSQDVMAPVFEFMDWEYNADFCQGIIGTGNKNFAGLYIQTAKELSAKHQIPILYDFEFSGMPTDVEKVEHMIQQLEAGAKVKPLLSI